MYMQAKKDSDRDCKNETGIPVARHSTAGCIRLPAWQHAYAPGQQQSQELGSSQHCYWFDYCHVSR